MHYKTIVLRLIEDRPALHSKLRRERGMMTAVDAHAKTLRTIHLNDLEAYRETVSSHRWNKGEALELAILELCEGLPSA